jgi:predicted negative regulator of RcsB-dependent stress response
MNKIDPQSFSVEALDKVGNFYQQSFEQLSQFYSSSFTYLLMYLHVAMAAAVVGLNWYFSRQSKAIQKEREEAAKLIADFQKEIQQKLDEGLEKLRSEFQKEKNK